MTIAGTVEGYCLPDFSNDRNEVEVCECELSDSCNLAFCIVSDKWEVLG
jgi:hypothetical protein